MCLDLDQQKLKSSSEAKRKVGAGREHLDCGTRQNVSLKSIIHYVTLRKLLNPTSVFFIWKNVFMHL